jgi:hypothetical protein
VFTCSEHLATCGLVCVCVCVCVRVCVCVDAAVSYLAFSHSHFHSVSLTLTLPLSHFLSLSPSRTFVALSHSGVGIEEGLPPNLTDNLYLHWLLRTMALGSRCLMPCL